MTNAVVLIEGEQIGTSATGAFGAQVPARSLLNAGPAAQMIPRNGRGLNPEPPVEVGRATTLVPRHPRPGDGQRESS